MAHATVKSMIAIGQSGQLGLNGLLPWEGNTAPEYVADVARFFDKTRGHVLLAGPKTISAVPDFAYEDRTIEVLPSCTDADNPPKYDPALYADLIIEFFSANYFHQKKHGATEIKNRY